MFCYLFRTFQSTGSRSALCCVFCFLASFPRGHGRNVFRAFEFSGSTFRVVILLSAYLASFPRGHVQAHFSYISIDRLPFRVVLCFLLASPLFPGAMDTRIAGRTSWQGEVTCSVCCLRLPRLLWLGPWTGASSDIPVVSDSLQMYLIMRRNCAPLFCMFIIYLRIGLSPQGWPPSRRLALTMLSVIGL